jgi:hypothetical protein
MLMSEITPIKLETHDAGPRTAEEREHVAPDAGECVGYLGFPALWSGGELVRYSRGDEGKSNVHELHRIWSPDCLVTIYREDRDPAFFKKKNQPRSYISHDII